MHLGIYTQIDSEHYQETNRIHQLVLMQLLMQVFITQLVYE